MKRFAGSVFAAALMGFLFIGNPAQAGARVVVIKKAPPAVRVEVRPDRPFRNAIWVAGHWGYQHGRYVWVSGRWIAPRHGMTYVSGHWKRVNHGWVWVEPHWRRI